MKISIVIPVYNEADSLRACLLAIAKQSLKPYEVIVVDNNSTDNSLAIIKDFDFVTLLHEKRQGVVHARTLGFDKASGDIIARIDADSLLPINWLKRVEEIFKGDGIDAVSGLASYYGLSAASLVSRFDLSLRRHVSKSLKKQNKMYLWGANMAIRRSAWCAVRSCLCQRSLQHEDFDIAIHLQELGLKVAFDERLKMLVSVRRIDMKFKDFMHYVMMSPRTYAQHGIKVKRQMYPLVAIVAICYLPAYLLYKGYDPVTDRFSFNRLMVADRALARVDPTTFVV